MPEKGDYACGLMQERTYRDWMGNRFPHRFLLRYKASDIWMGVGYAPSLERLQERLQALQCALYDSLDAYIERRPEFLSSLNPIKDDVLAPFAARQMMLASSLASTGPMAAVAGTFSQCIATEALRLGARDVVAENGGDLYLASEQDRVIAIHAGQSPFSERLGLKVHAAEMPLSLCTSSGTVGHSFSFGKADAVVVKAKDGALADALATSICNQIDEVKPMEALLERYLQVEGVVGILAVRRDQLAVAGRMELTKV